MDFSQRAAGSASLEIDGLLSALLDAAIVKERNEKYNATRGSGEGDVALKRIGAGYIGTECGRELAFRYHRAKVEARESSVSPGELERHAQAGFWTEAKTAEWMRLIGIIIETCQHDEAGYPITDAAGNPKQIGWMAARDPSGQARMAGEVDGVITYVGDHRLGALIPVPTIWESKKATDKKWKKFQKDKVKGADPRYYGQLQTNMAYLGIKQTLFSMLNLDTMKYLFELVPFDGGRAQDLTDRAAKIIETEHPYQIPRLGRTEDDFVCRFCDYKNQCWNPPSLTSALPKKFGGFNPNEMEDPPF